MIHLDATRRQDAIRAGWLAYAERVPEHLDAYLVACAGWQVVAVCDDDKPIGALYARDGVIHLGIVPEYRGRWASRRVIRQMLQYGEKTTVRDDEPQCIEFVTRIGFRKERGGYVFHR
jgi:GNAT superfamily N-acetyltransferase